MQKNVQNDYLDLSELIKVVESFAFKSKQALNLITITSLFESGRTTA